MLLIAFRRMPATKGMKPVAESFFAVSVRKPHERAEDDAEGECL
jgi:hypothetical protein